VTAGSFEEFVTDRSAGLLQTAYLLTGDRVQARELLQTTLMAVDRSWDRFADPEVAMTFARRELVAAHTGWRRLLRVGDLISDSPVLSSAAGFPGFVRRPTDPGPQDEVSVGLARLVPTLRATLVLRYGAGLSVADTAEALGRPVETVTADTARGLDLLDTDGIRLTRHLGLRAQQVTAAPEDALASARDGARARRNHRLGLVALAAVLAVVALLVVLSL
jgi:DNA-directed RNA polymerase specialized sigma24 family protein